MSGEDIRDEGGTLGDGTLRECVPCQERERQGVDTAPGQGRSQGEGSHVERGDAK